MTWIEILLAVVLGLIVNEMSDVSPWAARRMARWSARVRYRDSPRAEIRAEELAAVIDERPGLSHPAKHPTTKPSSKPASLAE